MFNVINRKSTRQRRRAGTAAVEFAVVSPIFVLLLLGTVELARGLMIQQTIINATREGAREAALPNSTIKSVKSRVVDFLANASIKVSTDAVNVSPDPSTAFNNEQITVTVAIPYDDVRWIPGSYLNNTKLRASTKMRSERLD